MVRLASGNPITDIAFTRLAVLFASNIVETRMSGGVFYDLLKAKQKGQTKIIIIDPRYSDSCATIADEWIPIKPSTDAALASALAYVIITENLADTAFLKTHSIGFDSESMRADIPER